MRKETLSGDLIDDGMSAQISAEGLAISGLIALAALTVVLRKTNQSTPFRYFWYGVLSHLPATGLDPSNLYTLLSMFTLILL